MELVHKPEVTLHEPPGHWCKSAQQCVQVFLTVSVFRVRQSLQHLLGSQDFASPSAPPSILKPTRLMKSGNMLMIHTKSIRTALPPNCLIFCPQPSKTHAEPAEHCPDLGCEHCSPKWRHVQVHSTLGIKTLV